MSITRTNGSPSSGAKRIAFILFRAVRSTLVIGIVAIAIFAIRRGGLRLPELKMLLIQNRTLLVMLFFGVLIWDYWFQRARERQLIGRNGADH